MVLNRMTIIYALKWLITIIYIMKWQLQCLWIHGIVYDVLYFVTRVQVKTALRLRNRRRSSNKTSFSLLVSNSLFVHIIQLYFVKLYVVFYYSKRFNDHTHIDDVLKKRVAFSTTPIYIGVILLIMHTLCFVFLYEYTVGKTYVSAFFVEISKQI